MQESASTNQHPHQHQLTEAAQASLGRGVSRSVDSHSRHIILILSLYSSHKYPHPPGHTGRGLAFPSQQPGLLAPDPRYPGFQFQSQFPIEKTLPDFHPIPGYLDPRLICLAWPLGEPSPVSVR